MERVRIAVLGAGYAGLAATLELQERLSRRAYDVVLVNQSPYHYFTTELHTLAVGAEEEAHLRIPLRRVVHPPGRLLVARVERIAPADNQVLLADRPPLAYDYCIAAVGSDPEYFNLPGVAEYGLPVGNPAAAASLRQRLEHLLAGAGPDRPLRVVIAGGGLTGVEVAGELADAHRGRLDITLVEAGPDIMPGFDPYLVGEACRVLTGKQVHVRTDTPIARVRTGHIEMQDGTDQPYDLFVWAGGVRGSALLEGSDLPTTRRGRVPVDAHLRAEAWPNLYLVGDAAAFADPQTGQELAPTAQAAVQMGRAAARNLALRLAGAPEEPFRPRIRGAFASLGRGAGVGYAGREQMVGLPAVVVKRLLEAQHAYEVGGVLSIVGRLLRPAARLLRWPARVVRRPAAGVGAGARAEAGGGELRQPTA